jgi:hypothetical protein
MSTIIVEVSEDTAKKFAGQDVVKIDDILDYEDVKWETIEVNEEAGVVLAFLKSINK